MKKFQKQTQERQETQETHMAIFSIPLFSFDLRKGMKKLKKITETQERQETQETHIIRTLFLAPPEMLSSQALGWKLRQRRVRMITSTRERVTPVLFPPSFLLRAKAERIVCSFLS